MNKTLPVRTFREDPDLDQLKRQAKELLRDFRDGKAEAVSEVNAYYRGADRRTFALHDAQLVVARSYGVQSWPKLKARVDGVTATRLCEAVAAGDLDEAREMLRRRPEIVNLQWPGHGEQRPMHIAVVQRNAPMVRLLMQNRADARIGIWPYRAHTQAFTIARERGYEEVSAIILEEEAQRGDGAAQKGEFPESEIDAAARAAVVSGDVEWLRARHAEGTLADPVHGGGLVMLAVSEDKPEILRMLLRFGFDPDARRREPGDDGEVLWGEPLAACTKSGKLAMAKILLGARADPNAWGVVWNAYRQRDKSMIRLLAEYGGVPNAATPGYLRDRELARKMFADEAAGRLPKVTVRDGMTVADEMLDPAATGGDTEIVRMALERVTWSSDDPRWYGVLASPMVFWHDVPWINTERWQMDRSTYIDCFRLVLERCGPNVVGSAGRTILHHAVASYDWVTPQERLPFVAALLDAGAQISVRDELFKSTPLGWACRWGRLEVAKLLLERGADPIERDSEHWATPRAWAAKMGHDQILEVLAGFGG